MEMILYSRVVPGSYASPSAARGLERVSLREVRRAPVRPEPPQRKDADQRRLSRRDQEQEGASGSKAGRTVGRYGELSDEERLQVEKLRARDAEVRAHEMAHLAAAGGYAKSGARYQYQVGPDGQQYAVGGEVALDIGKEASPEATSAKARVIQAAATAPASPSAQDLRVAAKAAMMAAEATAEMAKETTEVSEAEESDLLGILGDSRNNGRRRLTSAMATVPMGDSGDPSPAAIVAERSRLGWIVSQRYLSSIFRESTSSFLAYA